MNTFVSILQLKLNKNIKKKSTNVNVTPTPFLKKLACSDYLKIAGLRMQTALKSIFVYNKNIFIQIISNITEDWRTGYKLYIKSVPLSYNVSIQT